MFFVSVQMQSHKVWDGVEWYVQEDPVTLLGVLGRSEGLPQS